VLQSCSHQQLPAAKLFVYNCLQDNGEIISKSANIYAFYNDQCTTSLWLHVASAVFQTCMCGTPSENLEQFISRRGAIRNRRARPTAIAVPLVNIAATCVCTYRYLHSCSTWSMFHVYVTIKCQGRWRRQLTINLIVYANTRICLHG